MEAIQIWPLLSPDGTDELNPWVAQETEQQWGNDQDLHNCCGKALLGSNVEALQDRLPERGLYVIEAALGRCVRAWRRKREMVNPGLPSHL